nr:SAM-dependent methyltransferase [Pseudonocardia humida]
MGRHPARHRQDHPAGRAFLDRAVTHLAGEVGIRQFLDVGTGLPTANNTHEVAQSVAPTRASSTSTTTRQCSRTPAPC